MEHNAHAICAVEAALESRGVTPHRIEIDGCVIAGHILVAIPGVLGIDVLGAVVAVQLNVGRNGQVIPGAVVELRGLTPCGNKRGGGGVVELPRAVQRADERRGACVGLVAGGVVQVVRVGKEGALSVVAGVCQATLL